MLVAIVMAVSIESSSEQSQNNIAHRTMLEALPDFNMFVQTMTHDTIRFGLAPEPETNSRMQREMVHRAAYRRIHERGMSFGEMTNGQLYGIVFGYTILAVVICACIIFCVTLCCKPKEEEESDGN